MPETSGSDCIPVVVLKNWTWAFIHLAELSICVSRILVFQITGRSYCWSLYLGMMQERCAATNYHLLSLLSFVSKKLVNNRLVDHLENCSLFSDFQYDFQYWSTADLLTVVSDRILVFLLGATHAEAMDISMTFDRVLHAGLLNNFKSYWIWPFQTFGLILSFLIIKWLWLVLDGKSSQEYLVNTGVPQGSILGLTLALLYINYLLDDVTCNIAVSACDTTLYSKWDQASDIWQQLELASELESDLQNTPNWGRKCFVDFNAGKAQFVSFD